MVSKFTSKTNIFLIFLLIFTLMPASVFAQDGTQTYTTSDGLSFDYPEGWSVQSLAGMAFVMSSDSLFSADELAPGDVLILVMGNDTIASEYGDFDDLDAAAADLSSALDVDAPSAEPISIGGNDGYRFEMTDDFGRNVFIIMDIDGQFAAMFIATHPDDADNLEGTILAVAESMRYDGAEPTDGGTDFDFDDIDDPDEPSVDATPVGNEIIVWQQQSPVSDDIFNELSFLTSMSVSGDVVYVSDGLNLATVDGDGNFTNFVATSGFNYINVFAADTDGTIWAGSIGEDLFIHLDTDLSVIEGWNNEDFETPIFGDFLGVQEAAFSPDGDLYMFTGRYDEDFNTEGTILVWSGGEFVREFSIQGEDEFGIATYSYDAQIAFLPDGNMLLVDSSANMKVIDTDGNIIREDFPNSFESGIFGVNDVAVAQDGTIVLATFDGIVRLTPDGQVIDIFGSTQSFDTEDEPPFEAGQFSATGPQAVGILSDGTVIVMDSNLEHNQVMLLDYTLAE